MLALVKFDETHCHKWALLLCERRRKLDSFLDALSKKDFESAKCIFHQVFRGGSTPQHSDPGMAGSLLYHMAMVTKMATETRMILGELKMEAPQIDGLLRSFYYDFVSDIPELLKQTKSIEFDPEKPATKDSLNTKEKIDRFAHLSMLTRELELKLDENVPPLLTEIDNLFQIWSKNIIEMRLRQEYETIRGLLVTTELANTLGIERLETAMRAIQRRFGEETVNIALKVTLKVGMKRENLQTIMLSDHFINYTMDLSNLEGRMVFLNCPIFGSHSYIAEKMTIDNSVARLFCTHLCYAHAKSMLETVLPFTFSLSQTRWMAHQGKCEFNLKLAYSPNAKILGKHVPLVISWNTTLKCNLKCPHCYVNATSGDLNDELSTKDAHKLIDQISDVSRPMLILSGGEPLLRKDVFDLIQYGTSKGLRMAMGSNGWLIDDSMAKKLKTAGIKTVSISLDSSIPENHDAFRGVRGSWKKAISAIKALRANNVLVQVNTTVTQENYHEIEEIMSLVEKLGVENFHLFFLVPTGRATRIADISPEKYEEMIKMAFSKTTKHNLNVRPSCAPQFMRIAKSMGLDMRKWIRGCIAGLYYCRVCSNGEITPCPYLPIKLGNVRNRTFSDIWFTSPILNDLRNSDKLKGKCGRCTYRDLCGGCRARAYGLSSDFVDHCGDFTEPTSLKGDYLAEDPWCVHQPGSTNPRGPE